jgi:hypothetical protein
MGQGRRQSGGALNEMEQSRRLTALLRSSLGCLADSAGDRRQARRVDGAARFLGDRRQARATVGNEHRERANHERNERRPNLSTDERDYRRTDHDDDQTRRCERREPRFDSRHTRKDETNRAEGLAETDEAKEQDRKRYRTLQHFGWRNELHPAREEKSQSQQHLSRPQQCADSFRVSHCRVPTGLRVRAAVPDRLNGSSSQLYLDVERGDAGSTRPGSFLRSAEAVERARSSATGLEFALVHR